MNYCVRDNRKIGLCDLIITILVLFGSGYALTTGGNIPLVSGVLSVALLYKTRFFLRIPRRDPKLAILCLMVFALILSFVVNGDFGAMKTYIYTALFIFNGFIARYVYSGKQVVNAFIRVLLIGAIAAIVVAAVDKVIPVAAFAPKVKNGAGTEYYTLGLINYQTRTYLTGKRSCGLFWEPGMFSGMLALAATLDIYTRRDGQQIWRIMAYCAAIITTFSTAGYVYLLMIGLMMAIRNKTAGRGMIVLMSLGIAVLIFSSQIQSLLSKLFNLLPQVFDKIKNENLSYKTRVLSPIVDVMLMIQHPFGTGFSELSAMRTGMMGQFGIQTSLTTSTLTYFGVSSGIIFFIAYNYSWISGLISGRQKTALKLFCIMVYALVLTSNPMFNNQLIWMFIFMNFSDLEEGIEGVAEKEMTLKAR